MPEQTPHWAEMPVPVKNPLDELKDEIRNQREISAVQIQKLGEEIKHLAKTIEIAAKKNGNLEEKNTDFATGLQKIATENASLAVKVSAHLRYLDKVILGFAVIFFLMYGIEIWQKRELLRQKNVRIIENTSPIAEQKIVVENEALKKKLNDVQWENTDLRKKLTEIRQKK